MSISGSVGEQRETEAGRSFEVVSATLCLSPDFNYSLGWEKDEVSLSDNLMTSEGTKMQYLNSTHSTGLVQMSSFQATSQVPPLNVIKYSPQPLLWTSGILTPLHLSCYCLPFGQALDL